MKNSYQIWILLMCCSIGIINAKESNACLDCEVTSRSVLITRPHFLAASPERVSMFRDKQLYASKLKKHGALQWVFFGSRSIRSDVIARYFSPFCRQTFCVDEQLTSDNRTLNAQHFNIHTKNKTFTSRVSLAPTHDVFGGGFEYHQVFLRREDTNRQFWINIACPITHVTNNMHVTEHIIDDGGGRDTNVRGPVVANMKEALMQPAWKHGKLSACNIQKTSIADIECTVGIAWVQHKPYHLESYIGVLIPTTHEPSPEFLFEPIIGYAGHSGVMFGNKIGFELTALFTNIHVRMEIANHTVYLFEKTDKRLLDLKYKPWSRYMHFYKDKSEALHAALLADPITATQGVDLLTQWVDVQPGVANTFNTAGVLTYKSWHAEGGYNIYTRSADALKLHCPWPCQAALQARSGSGNTNPVRNITSNSVSEQVEVAAQHYDLSVIKEHDLDLQSATHPCCLTHTLYASLGYTHEGEHYPLFSLVGGSYTFSNNERVTAVVRKWTIWIKAGFSF